MTGGIPAAIFLLAERIRKKQFEWRAFFIVFIVIGFFAASFQTWRDEYAHKSAAEAIREQHVAMLKQFYAETNDLWREVYSIPQNISPEDYKKLIDKADTLSRRLEDWVRTNMGPGANAHLLRIPTAPGPTYSSAISKNHNSELNALASTKQAIEDLITNPAWDAPSPKSN